MATGCCLATAGPQNTCLQEGSGWMAGAFLWPVCDPHCLTLQFLHWFPPQLHPLPPSWAPTWWWLLGWHSARRQRASWVGFQGLVLVGARGILCVPLPALTLPPGTLKDKKRGCPSG